MDKKLILDKNEHQNGFTYVHASGYGMRWRFPTIEIANKFIDESVIDPDELLTTPEWAMEYRK